MARPVTFWFEFASTYSYLSAMRIDQVAKAHGVEVIWKPFLLGPIFKAQGWDTSPFSIYPEKGRNMWRDLERRAAKYGLPFNPEAQRLFPQNSVYAARLAIIGLSEGWGEAFCRRVYQAVFIDAADISQPDTLGECLDDVGADKIVHLPMVSDNQHKQALRDHTEQAMALGLFGAPSFTVDEEVFWGDDRLEDALEWAKRV